ncbi:uncharacterized protein LOC134256866 [Saccostrea cucullata]|uniref:uncharacterized protein LOC134256866 n=1 Tax=Saccostrea cuccullata TaxID=36930 RepID=UPI002ED58C93
MTSSKIVFEQLRVLTGKLSELENSNSALLSTLNERDGPGNQVMKPTITTDLNRTLDILRDQTRKSETDLKTLKDTLSILSDRVHELSTTVKNRSQRNNQNLESNLRTQKKNESLTTDTKRKQEIKSAESERCVAYTCASEVNDSPRNDSNITMKAKAKDQQNELIPKRQLLQNISIKTNTEGKPSLQLNTYGLRSRAVSPDIDNRVRLIKGKSIEKGQEMSRSASTDSSKSDASGREKTVKENLQTADNLKHLPDEEQIKSKKKQTTYHPSIKKNEHKNLASVDKDPNAVPDIRDLNSWRTLAEAERKRGLSLHSLPVGKGPDTCLLLDISGSMEGEMFNEMMAAVRTFIDGIAGVAAVLGIEENIGIATFGAQTTVIQHMSNDYDRVIKTLDLLTPSGPSPMSAGLYMAMACCLGHVGKTSIKNIRIRPRIIMFSDGKGTLDTRVSGEDDFRSESTVLTRMWLNEAAEDLERRHFRVYPVCLTKTTPDMILEVCKKTHGKMYKSSEIPKLVRMTQNMSQAIGMIDRGVDFEEDNIFWRNKPGMSENPLLNDFGFDEDREEISHLGKYLNDHETSNFHKEYKDSNLPALGARVRRGPDWMWNDQDQGGPGTVVGHDGHTSVWVVWDCGHLNTYRCHPFLGYDILLVDEPRVPERSRIAVGCLVERGEHWRDENKDGGIGNVGVVINIKENGRVLVRWPNMEKGRYKFGSDGLFEIKLCDPLKVYGSVSKLTTNVREVEESLKGVESMLFKDKILSSASHSAARSTCKNGEYKKEGTKEQVKEDAPNPNSGCGFDIIWAYKKNGRWFDFPQNINTKMEKAYGRNNQGSMILEIDGYVWRAFFSNMKMECQKTHTWIEILRNEIID